MEQKSTVLVIDDYAPARDAVKFALKADFVCLTAGSAREGLEILRTNPVDVVILDIRMPGMDGIQALKRIKEMGIGSQVILLTGHGSLETAREAIRHGASDYLVKPFNVKDLRNIVTEAVRKKRLLEEGGKDGELERLSRSFTAKLAEASRLARSSELSSEALNEMKNPLTAVLGYTQMLLKKLRYKRIRLFSTTSVRYLSIIEEEAKRCVEIASRLLSGENLSRDGATINEVMLNTAALLRPQCLIRGVELLVTPPQEKVIVDAPADDLHAVLVNLVLNSIEAVEGRGRIGIRGYQTPKDSPLLELASQSEKEFLQETDRTSLAAIEVSDTGRGIDPRHLDRVFEPFFTTKPDGSGAGLGLPICREKVERCGGHIGVVGSGPVGTTMRVLLPVSSRV